MLDISLIRNDPQAVRAALLKRLDEVDLESIIKLDEARRACIESTDNLKAERNRLSREIGLLKQQGGDASEKQARISDIREELAALEAKFASVSAEFQERMAELPNLPADIVPSGGKEANQVVKVWGEKPNLGNDPLDHVELCKRLRLVDFERGTKLSGSGFWIYTGAGAALEWALINYFCQTHYRDGYNFLLPPHMLMPECGYAAGQFPKFADDVFHISSKSSDRGLFLLPTSETAILNFFRDEIIEYGQLPYKAFAYTPCYRREPGGYRSEERGTVRGHQFNKVEMFQFCTEDQWEEALAELVRKTETLVEGLGLHYRTSLLAARDASASMRLTYDVEVWLPSIGIYKEVSSASYAGDYQARRAKIRYRPKDGGKPRLVHTLNSSGLATSRVLPALLEQCQQPDGLIRVPEPLRPWLGCDVIGP
ncbi:MAG: serine--tRNA ligase [Betaproteobacteria bacterium]|nr:serine--tRNA ligase [Betaproteobacteria bacterium]